MRTQRYQWPVSGGCKITTYLESQTRSFYYTYNFHPATMMIKGSLLSDTAIVEYFQTKKNPSPPEWQAPLPVRISQPYVVIEKKEWWGYKAEKKFDDIFIRFDTLPASDRQTDTLLRQRLPYAMHCTVKNLSNEQMCL